MLLKFRPDEFLVLHKSDNTYYPFTPLNSYSSCLLIVKKRGCHCKPSFWRTAVSSRCLFSINVFSSVAASMSFAAKPAVTLDHNLLIKKRVGERGISYSNSITWLHPSNVWFWVRKNHKRNPTTYFLDSFHSWSSKGSTDLAITGFFETLKNDSLDEFCLHNKKRWEIGIMYIKGNRWLMIAFYAFQASNYLSLDKQFFCPNTRDFVKNITSRNALNFSGNWMVLTREVTLFQIYSEKHWK